MSSALRCSIRDRRSSRSYLLCYPSLRPSKELSGFLSRGAVEERESQRTVNQYSYRTPHLSFASSPVGVYPTCLPYLAPDTPHRTDNRDSNLLSFPLIKWGTPPPPGSIRSPHCLTRRRPPFCDHVVSLHNLRPTAFSVHPLVPICIYTAVVHLGP